MTGKRKNTDNKFYNNNNTKRQQRGPMFPALAGLPAKPVFQQNAENSDRRNNQTAQQHFIHSSENSTVELFPGMMVNLPNENSPFVSNNNSLPNNTPQPASDALQLLGSILGTLQQNQQQNQQQHQQQHGQQQHGQQQHGQQQQGQQQQGQQYHYPQYNTQYNAQYNSATYAPYNQQSNTYDQAYPQSYPQSQQILHTYTNSNTPQYNANNHQQPNNTLVSMFTQFMQNYGVNAASDVPVNNNNNTQSPVPLKPTSNNSTKKNNKIKAQKKQKQQQQAENKEKVNKEKQQDFSDDDLLDDEAEWEKKVAIQGTNIIFENDEDIQKWIDERKKNWPTNKRVEEKRKEVEKAKKIMENLNNQSDGSNQQPKVKMCNFWLKHRKCKNGKNCKYSHDISNYSQPNLNTKSKSAKFSTRPLPNHKIKLISGIPVQIPSRFTPMQNEGKSLHKLMVEGDQVQSENVELLNLFSKLVKNGIIKKDWEGLKKKLKLDDESLNLK